MNALTRLLESTNLTRLTQCTLIALLALGAGAARAQESDEAQCAKGIGGLCFAHAFKLKQAGHPEEATRFYQRACELTKGSSDERGCLEFADALQGGVGVAKDQARALRLFEETCEHEGEACRPMLIQRLLDGKIGPKADPARALAIAKPMCDRDDGFACRIVMEAYKKGLGTAADPVKAAAAEKKLNRILAALTANNNANNDAAKDLARQQTQRDREEHDKVLANPAPYKEFDATCAAGNRSACELPVPYFIYVDLKHAEELLARYYQGSESVESYSPWYAEAARKLASNGQAQAGRDLAQAGCDAGIIDACAVAGNLLATGRDGLPKELARGRKMLNQVCNQGSLLTCMVLFSVEPVEEYPRIRKQMERVTKLKAEQDRKKAQAELELEKLLIPYVAKLDALHEESEAQKQERFAPDRLPAAEFAELHPDATPEDLASAEAWRQRRAVRQQEIKQLVEALKP